MFDVKVEKIGPVQASELLAINSCNRSIRANRIKAIVEEIRAGKWCLTSDPIVISKDGRLLGGQHRLWGVKETGATVECLVVRNADPGLAAFIDAGAPRSLSDRLRMMGCIKVRSRETVAVMRSFFEQPEWNLYGHRVWSASDAEEAIKAVGSFLRFSASCFSELGKSRVKCAAVRAAVARAKYFGIDSEILRSFVRLLVTGDPSEIRSGEVDSYVRRVAREVQEFGSRGALDASKNYRLTTHAIVYFQADEKRKKLDYSMVDDFPLVGKAAKLRGEASQKVYGQVYNQAQKKLLAGEDVDIGATAE